MIGMRSSSASPPRQPSCCPLCGCSCSPLPPSKRRASGDPFGGASSAVARVASVDERRALREAFLLQSEALEDLRRDLEEERSASSSAASEAMSMILRLQHEKAEIKMDARQFREFAEEKIAHDQNQIASLEDECYRRERAVEALLLEVSAYRSRLVDLGLDPDSETPQARCHPAAESPRISPLAEIDERIGKLERGGRGVWELDVTEKAVVESAVVPDVPPKPARDDACDRVYTVDAIHGTAEATDIRKLYMRLQALEAEGELQKQEILSLRKEKTQVVLLKEIADNLSKGMVVAAQPPLPIPSKKPSFSGMFSFFSAIKLIFSAPFWRRNKKRCRYMFQYVNGRVGLLILLDQTKHARPPRCITRPLGCGESSSKIS